MRKDGQCAETGRAVTASAMLQRITPVILTRDEAPNIGRTLERLRWARDIVVLDSFSTDATADIVAGFPNARLLRRAFDSHAAQWTFALRETGVATDWVFALDADYLASEALIAEIATLDPDGPIDAWTTAFDFCVLGRRLRSALYPPVTTLFRPARARYVQDGHTQRVAIDGAIGVLKARLTHDDRKPLSRWLAAQDRYMRLEAEALLSRPRAALGFADRLRLLPPLAPLAVFAHCYLLRGGFRDGRAGLHYALQRMLAEALLGLRLIERRLDGEAAR